MPHILAPFPDVAVHVVEAKGVGDVAAADWGGLFSEGAWGTAVVGAGVVIVASGPVGAAIVGEVNAY